MAITFDINLVDKTGRLGSYGAVLTASCLAAGNAWAANFYGDASLQVHLVIDERPGRVLATGGSVSSGYLGKRNGLDTWMSGATFEMKTGTDPNGAEPDIRITIDPDTLPRSVWGLEPTQPGSGMFDGFQIMMHEFGHAFGFSNWGKGVTYQNTFTEQVIVRGASSYFAGPVAMALYGRAIPLTAGNASHYGNEGGEGSDLSSGLMWPKSHGAQAAMPRALDFAILYDTGAPMKLRDSTAAGDLLFGTAVDETIDGLGGNDCIAGGAGADHLLGGLGKDKLLGLDGNDTLNGGAGEDTAYYRSARTAYELTKVAGGFEVEALDPANPDGADTLTGVERIRFADKMYSVRDLLIPINDAPVLSAGQAFEMSEDAVGVTGQIAATDSEGDPLTFAAKTKLPAGLVLNADGTFAYTAPASFNGLKEGEVRTVTFQVAASDGIEAGSTTISWTVVGKNDVILAKDDVATLGVRSVAVAVLRNDLDADRGDTKTLVSSSAGAWGTTSIVGATVKYEVEGKVVKIGAGQALTDSFTYTVKDSTEAPSDAKVLVKLAGQAVAANAARAVALTLDKDDIVTVDLAALANVAFDAAKKLKPVATVTGFMGDDALVLMKGDTRFQGTSASDYDGLTKLADVAAKAASLLDKGEATTFEFQGSTYVYVEQNDGDLFNRGDGLIRLAGVTGLQSSGGTGWLKFGLPDLIA